MPAKGKAATKRKPISKSVRFEVFKRDSFKCQYCGATAPEALLQVDHIEPVASGGTNDLTNLVTSCQACNSGKGARLLEDKSVVQRQRTQLEELQERREQLEMMFEWQKGLNDLAQDAVRMLAETWQTLAPGWTVNAHGMDKLRRWSARFSTSEILDAMRSAASIYLQAGEDGNVTGESWEVAFKKIPAICTVNRDSASNPDLRELFYIRGILRKRFGLPSRDDTMGRLKDLVANGWEPQQLREIAVSARTWYQFWNNFQED